MSVKLRLARAEDLDAAADTLAAAFENYPWTRYVIPEQDYQERLRTLQRLYLVHAQQHGIVTVTESVDGVLALLPPDAPEPAPEVIAQVMVLHGERIDRLTQTAHAPGAWRLETLGVHPGSQGNGIGNALLTFSLAEAAQRGAREVALETSDPQNVRLYARHGFSVDSQTQTTKELSVWSMSASVEAAGPSS